MSEEYDNIIKLLNNGDCREMNKREEIINEFEVNLFENDSEPLSVKEKLVIDIFLDYVLETNMMQIVEDYPCDAKI